MKVHFSKLDNGEWICYDSMNNYGDRFVDPTKLGLLTSMVEHHSPEPDPSYIYLVQDQVIEVPGYGKLSVRLSVLTVKGVIQDAKLYKHGTGMELATFSKQFVLELPEVPAFENYNYPGDEDSVG